MKTKIMFIVLLFLMVSAFAFASTPQDLILEARGQVPAWTTSTAYEINDLVSFNERVYIVIQAHTSQSGWNPVQVPALFTEYAFQHLGEIPEFKQPSGSHDAYANNYLIRYNGYIFKSLISANVYSPSAYPQGWTQIAEAPQGSDIITTANIIYSGHGSISGQFHGNESYLIEEQLIGLDNYTTQRFNVSMYVGTHGVPYAIYSHEGLTTDRELINTQGEYIFDVISEDGFLNYESRSFSTQIATIPTQIIGLNDNIILNMNDYYSGYDSIQIGFFDGGFNSFTSYTTDTFSLTNSDDIQVTLSPVPGENRIQLYIGGLGTAYTGTFQVRACYLSCTAYQSFDVEVKDLTPQPVQQVATILPVDIHGTNWALFKWSDYFINYDRIQLQWNDGGSRTLDRYIGDSSSSVSQSFYMNLYTSSGTLRSYIDGKNQAYSGTVTVTAYGGGTSVSSSFPVTTSVQAIAPTVTTLSADMISDTGMRLRGDVTSFGSESEVTARILYREIGAASFSTTSDQQRSTTGVYTSTISGLTACTTYEYFALVEYGVNVVDGATLTTTTTGCAVPVFDGLSDGLVAYYKLDETTGTVASDSHSTNHGTASNSQIFTSNTGTSGKINSGVDFTQGADTISISSPSSMPSGATSRSINYWVKPTTRAGALFEMRPASSGQGFLLAYSVSGPNTLLFTDSVNGNNNVHHNSLFVNDEWMMITFVLTSSTTYEVYKNGVDVTSGTDKAGTFGTAINTGSISALTIGGRTYGATDYADAFMDEVGIWNRALTQDEISGLYNSGESLSYDSFGAGVPAEMSTPSITGVTQSEATFSSTVTFNDDESVINVYYQYREQGDTTWTDTTSESLLSSGFGLSTRTVTGLNPSTDYDMRLVYFNSAGLQITTIQTFRTDAFDAGVISTPAVTDIQENSATFTSFPTLNDDTSLDIIFQVREQGSDIWTSGVTHTANANILQFEPFTGFTANTVYEVRASYEGVLPIAYTDIVTFTTLEEGTLIAPVMSIPQASNITQTSFTVSSTPTLNDYGVIFVSVQYRVQGGQFWTTTSPETVTLSGFPYFRNIGGLQSNATYEYRMLYEYDGITSNTATNTLTLSSVVEDPETISDVESMFNDILSGTGDTGRWIVALIIIVALFVMLFQLTNTVVGGLFGAMIGFLASIFFGLISIWVLILLMMFGVIIGLLVWYFGNRT